MPSFRDLDTFVPPRAAAVPPDGAAPRLSSSLPGDLGSPAAARPTAGAAALAPGSARRCTARLRAERGDAARDRRPPGARLVAHRVPRCAPPRKHAAPSAEEGVVRRRRRPSSGTRAAHHLLRHRRRPSRTFWTIRAARSASPEALKVAGRVRRDRASRVGARAAGDDAGPARSRDFGERGSAPALVRDRESDRILLHSSSTGPLSTRPRRRGAHSVETPATLRRPSGWVDGGDAAIAALRAGRPSGPSATLAS